jgi:hypothetical protein
MYLCNADPEGRVLCISYGGRVGPDEVDKCFETVRELGDVLKRGFFLFTDMSHLETMDLACAPTLGKIMEECSERGLACSVRVIPKEKDIGLGLIAHFHYPPHVRNHTHETLAEALSALLAEHSQVSALS